jgi:hypothetical protein
MALRERLGPNRDWPFALDDSEQLSVKTLAEKSFAAGHAGITDADDAYLGVADGIAEFNVNESQLDAARREARMREDIATAPSRATQARSAAKAHDAEAQELEERAKVAASAAADIKQKEEGLPPGRRAEIKTGSLKISISESSDAMWIAILGAVVEGGVLLAQVLKGPLNTEQTAFTALSGMAISFIAVAVALIVGRNLATDVDEPEKWREALLITAIVLLFGVMVGLLIARSEGWFISLAIAATWTSAAIVGYEKEKRSEGGKLLSEQLHLQGEADRLAAGASRERMAAEAARADATGIETAAAALGEEIGGGAAAKALASERAEALKRLYRGIVEAELAAGRAARHEAASDPVAAPLGRRAALGAAAVFAILAAVAWAMVVAGESSAASHAIHLLTLRGSS